MMVSLMKAMVGSKIAGHSVSSCCLLQERGFHAISCDDDLHLSGEVPQVGLSASEQELARHEKYSEQLRSWTS